MRLLILAGALMIVSAQPVVAQPLRDDYQPRYRERGTFVHRRPGYWRPVRQRGPLARTLRRNGMWNWADRLERLHARGRELGWERAAYPRWRYVPRCRLECSDRD